MDIPLDVEVHCTDGVVGRSITTVTKSGTKRISHIIVADKEAPYTKRLVPVSMIKKVRPKAIVLDCTRDVLLKIEQLEKVLVNPNNAHDGAKGIFIAA